MADRYGFQSPGAAMQNAIAEELLRRELLKRQAEQDRIAAEQRAQQAQQQSQSSARADAMLALQQAQEARITGNQQREQSDAANARGMRLMTADAMRMPGILDNRDAMRQLAASAYGETGDVPDMLASALAPPKRTVMSVPGPEGPMRRAVSEEELIEGVPEYQDPKDGGNPWINVGGGYLFNSETEQFKRVPGGGAGGGGGTQKAPPESPVSDAYTAERRTRIRDAVADVDKNVNNLTTGAGSYLSWVRGSPGRDFEGKVNYLKANVGFSELTEMRAASKTGGALGQVSDRELTLLTSALGALDVGQSPAAFKAQLKNITDSLDRWEAAKARYGQQPAASGAGGGPGPTVQRWGRDAQGRPVRLP